VITRESFTSTLNMRRFQSPPTFSPAGRGELGPAIGDPDQRVDAARAVSAARLPRFEPSRPDRGDEAVAAGAGPNGTATLSAPAANVATAGPVAGGPDAVPGGETSPSTAIVPPAVSAGENNRLPIFESVESDWFRRGRHATDRSAPLPASDSAAWSSPADEGWRAAEVAQAPVSEGKTGAGLPKRVPKANLVPGGIGPSAGAPAAPARSAAQTRQRLASFQRGIREARASLPEDESPTSDAADSAT